MSARAHLQRVAGAALGFRFRPPRVLMIGTSRRTQGGISAVVNVYAACGLFERCEVEYVATHCDGPGWKKAVLMLSALLRFCVALVLCRPRLVHVHLASRASFWRKSSFMALASWLQVPYLIHLHGAQFDAFYQNELGAFGKAQVRRRFRRAAAVVVLSETWGRWVREAMPGVNPTVVANPVVLPAPGCDGSRSATTVLSLGRLGRRKGTYDLLEAVALLAGRWPGLRLRLGGDGDLDGARRRAGELGIADRVEFLGWVSGAAKEEALATAAIYALPSYQEGLPMSLLEAMAAGCPVVSTPVGGIPEAVRQGVEGFLVEPGDVAALSAQIENLLSAPELRVHCGRAARCRVRELFSAEAVSPQIEAVYRMTGPRPPSGANRGTYCPPPR